MTSDPSTTPQWVAAIAACIAAGVVIWQSVATQQSARASKKAAEAASEGLGVANSALEVARREEQNSRSIIGEAIRTRMDAAAPHVEVRAHRTNDRPWRAVDLRDATRTPIDVLEWFGLPQDETLWVGVDFEARVINRGETAVRVWLLYLNRAGTEIADEAVTIEPGTDHVVPYAVVQRLRAWIEGNELNQYGLTPSSICFQATVRLDADSGAADGWTSHHDGSPIEVARRSPGDQHVLPNDLTTEHLPPAYVVPERFTFEPTITRARTYYVSVGRDETV